MVNVIGIRFQPGGKLYYFDPGETQPSISDKVLVETSRGFELGEVIMPAREVSESSVVAPLKTVIRLATEDDLKHEKENREKEKEAFRICQEKIAANNLEMKLVRSEIGFDNNKILFYFTANGRVDFRALVKDHAAVFKTRIELRQIGVRDEARMIGGLGPCGRPICCDSFLEDFEPVSIKMAKEQKLSLNPTKISGVCGRLMCCLKYEEDQYEEVRKRMPKVGKEIRTPGGSAVVLEQNILKETVSCRVTHGDTSEIREYTLDELVEMGAAKPPVQEQANESVSDAAVEAPEKNSGISNAEEAGENEQTFVQSDDMEAISDAGDSQKQRERGSQKRKPEKRESKAADSAASRQKDSEPRKTEGNVDGKNGFQTEHTVVEAPKPSAHNQADAWRAALEKAMQAAGGKSES